MKEGFNPEAKLQDEERQIQRRLEALEEANIWGVTEHLRDLLTKDGYGATSSLEVETLHAAEILKRKTISEHEYLQDAFIYSPAFFSTSQRGRTGGPQVSLIVSAEKKSEEPQGQATSKPEDSIKVRFYAKPDNITVSTYTLRNGILDTTRTGQRTLERAVWQPDIRVYPESLDPFAYPEPKRYPEALDDVTKSPLTHTALRLLQRL